MDWEGQQCICCWSVCVRGANLLDFGVFEEGVPVGVAAAGEVYVQGLGIGHVEDLSIIRKIHAHDIFGMFFDYLGRFELFEDLRGEL